MTVYIKALILGILKQYLERRGKRKKLKENKT